MKWSFWSDEDRWFVPRAFGLGYSLNFKYVAKRLGWIKPRTAPPTDDEAAGEPRPPDREDREQRLRDRIESSKYEDDG